MAARHEGDLLTAIPGAAIEEPPQGFSSETEQQNVKLKTNVIELEDLLETTSQVQLENVYSNKDLLQSRNDSSLDSLRHFEEFYRCPTSSYYSKEKLVQSMSLQITMELLMSQLSIIRKMAKVVTQTPSSTPLGRQLESPLGLRAEEGATAADALSNHSGHSRTSQVTSLPKEVLEAYPRVQELLASLDSEASLSDVKALEEELSRWLRTLFPMGGESLCHSMVHVRNVAHTDVNRFVKEKLAASQPLLQAALQTVDELRIQFDEISAALASRGDEAVEEYERILLSYIGALEKALQISKSRVVQVSMSSDKSNDEENFRSAYERCNELVQSSFLKFRASIDDLTTKLASDKTALTQERTTRENTHTKCVQDFIDSCAAGDEKMAEFSRQQHQLWDEVAAKIQEIGSITAKRHQEVKRRLQAAETEHRRRRYHEEWIAVAEKHEAHLKMVEALSNESRKVLDSMEEFYEHVQVKVETKNFEEGLEPMRGPEYSNFLSLYKPYAIAVTTLLDKKDANIVVAESTIRLAQEQVTEGGLEKKKASAIRHNQSHLIEALKSTTTQYFNKLEYWENWAVKVKQLANPSESTDNAKEDAAVFVTASLDKVVADLHQNLESERARTEAELGEMESRRLELESARKPRQAEAA